MNSFFAKKISPNGPKVILVPQDNAQTVTLLVLLPVGSRYEESRLKGASHFIEHLVFKGTKRRPSNFAIAQQLDRLGGEYNGFTAKNYTGYWVKTIRKHLKTSLDLLSDMLFNSLFRKEDFQKEKGVIIEEIKMYRDNPMFYIESLFERTLYGFHPLGDLISGEISQVRGLKLKELLSFKERFYQSNNLVVVLAGKVSKEDARLVKQYFPSAPSLLKQKTFQPFRRRLPCQKVKILPQDTKQIQIALGGIAYPYNHRNLEALDILCIILGGYMSSRLFSKIRVEKGLAYFVKMESNSYEDTGNFVIRAGVDKKNTRKTIELILEELSRIQKEPPSKEEVKRAKDYYEGKVNLSLEDSANLAAFYGEKALFYPRISTPHQQIEKIKKVTPLQIQKVARELFQRRNLSLALIGPFKGKDKRAFSL